MDAFAWLDESFSLRLAVTLLHFLWQGVAVALLVVVVGWLLRRASAQMRYVVNVAAMLVLVSCLPVTFALVDVSRPIAESGATRTPVGSRLNESKRLHDNAIAMPGGTAVIDTDSDSALSPMLDTDPPTPEARPSDADASPDAPVFQTLSWLFPVAPYLTLIYLAGVLLMMLRLVTALWGGQKLRCGSTPLNDGTLLAMVKRQAQRIGLKIAPAVAFCEQISIPVVVGVVKPIILLPAALASGLSPDQLQALVTHELAHIRRFDLIVNLLQRLIESVLFFHPAVWFVSRRVSVERENAADDMVLAAGWQRANYADALVRMAELSSALRNTRVANPAAALAASGANTSDFKRRVLRLLEASDQSKFRLTRRGVLLFVTMCAALLIMAMVQANNKNGSDDSDSRETNRPMDGPKSTVRALEPPSAGEVAAPATKRPRFVLSVELRHAKSQPIGEHVMRLVSPGSSFPSMLLMKSGDRFEVDFQSAGQVGVLLIDIPGFTPTNTPEFTVGPELKPIVVELEPAVPVRITGTVKNADGKPLPGARVRVRRIFYGTNTQLPWGAETSTDAEGRFGLKHLRAGEVVSIAVDKEGVGQHETKPFEIGKQAKPIELAAIRLGVSDQEVSGHVKGFGHVRIKDLTVSLVGQPRRKTKTDAKGHFNLTGLPNGWLQLLLTGPDGSQRRRRVIAGSQDVVLYVPLKMPSGRPEYQLSVELKTSDEKLPANASYYVLDLTDKRWRQSGGFGGKRRRQIGMNVELRALADHRIALMVLADGYAKPKPININFTTGKPRPIVVSLRAATMGTLRGRVIDGSGKPVAGAKIGMSRMLAAGVRSEPWKYRMNTMHVTDAEGRFELSGIHQGSHVAIYVNKTGYAGLWSDRVTFGKSAEVTLPDLKLRKATRQLKGRVVNADGQPIAGATVFVHDFAQQQTTTDANGRFQLDGVPNGNLSLATCAFGFKRNTRLLSADETTEQFVVKLERDPDQPVPIRNIRSKPRKDTREDRQDSPASSFNKKLLLPPRNGQALSKRIQEAANPSIADGLVSKAVQEKATRDAKPDGVITWIDNKTQTVWINLGIVDGLRRHTTFSILSTADHARGLPERGSIEVTRLIGPHLSEARFVQHQRARRIAKDDLIFSPVWSPVPRDTERLQGLWQVTSAMRNGILDRAEIGTQLFFVEHYLCSRMSADVFLSSTADDKVRRKFRLSTFHVDSSQAPKHLDFISSGDGDDPFIQKCVYSLSGDVLTIAAPVKFAKRRPQDVVSRKGDALWVIQLTRLNPADVQPPGYEKRSQAAASLKMLKAEQAGRFEPSWLLYIRIPVYGIPISSLHSSWMYREFTRPTGVYVRGAVKDVDAVLRQLENLTGLEELRLTNARVVDAHLKQLKTLKTVDGLQTLHLTGAKITNGGLAHLSELTNLTELRLDYTEIGDAGLAHLRKLTKLEELQLGNSNVTDAGLVHLQMMRNLQTLNLISDRITDAGLDHLRMLSDLRTLSLCRTKVTNAGLARLKPLKRLRVLDLSGTEVTDDGVNALRKTLPSVRIENVGVNQDEDKGRKRDSPDRSESEAQREIKRVAPNERLVFGSRKFQPPLSADDRALRNTMQLDPTFTVGLSEKLRQPRAIAAWTAFLQRKDLTREQQVFAWWRIGSLAAYNFDPARGETADFALADRALVKVHEIAKDQISLETLNTATVYGGLPGKPTDRAQRLAKAYRWLFTRTDAMVKHSAARINRNGYAINGQLLRGGPKLDTAIAQ